MENNQLKEQNKKALYQGIQRTITAIPLMFIGPSLIYNAWINTHSNWHYLVLAVGFSICIYAVYRGFTGIKRMVAALFNDEN